MVYGPKESYYGCFSVYTDTYYIAIRGVLYVIRVSLYFHPNFLNVVLLGDA